MTKEITFAETFIGECVVGTCTRPATVRVHENFVLCAMHHLHREAGEDFDEANLALELIAGWHSMANFHGNDYLDRMFAAAEEDLEVLRDKAQRRQKQAERVEVENIPNEEVRMQMGEKAKEKREEASEEEYIGKGRENWTPQERAEYDAQAELQAWEFAQRTIEPMVQLAGEYGSAELEGVMDKAREEVEANVSRARAEFERVEATL